MIPSRGLVVVGAEANWGENRPGDPTATTNRLITLLLEADGVKTASTAAMRVQVDGECKVWHPVSFTFQGPESSETADPNPFRDDRLTVTFTHAGQTRVVPGFFAADGSAGETGAEKGDRWRARFLPDSEGGWVFHADLVRGPDVAIHDEVPGELVGVAVGTFSVGPSDKQAPDARAIGLAPRCPRALLRLRRDERRLSQRRSG